MSNRELRSEPTRDIDTDGGAFIEGGVDTGGGDVAGRDLITTGAIAAENVAVGGSVVVHNWFGRGSSNTRHHKRDRQQVLAQVRKFWINGVLEPALRETGELELGMVLRPDLVQRPWDGNRRLVSGTDICAIFRDEALGQLLILGAPGSGKTIVLLRLACELVMDAERNSDAQIPVVLNLSSWAEKRQAIAEWLVDQLEVQYTVPRKTSKRWLEQGSLLPLLDGLDEVDTNDREACANAINEFRETHGVHQLVVVSRIADYKLLSRESPLRGLGTAIILIPLTLPQIDLYLERSGDELAGLRMLLREDMTLKRLAQSPLMLNIMVRTYRGSQIPEISGQGTIEERQTALLAAYVRRMLHEHRRNEPSDRNIRRASRLPTNFRGSTDTKPYSASQTMHWLAYIAKMMCDHGQTVLFIERLHPSWLTMRGLQLSYFGYELIMILLTAGVPFGLFMALLVGGLIMPAIGYDVSFADAVRLAAVTALAFGLLLSLSELKNLRNNFNAKPLKLIETLRWSWRGLFLAILIGLSLGVYFGLVFGWTAGAIAGGMLALLAPTGMALTSREVKLKTIPNEGIYRSARNGWRVGLISTPLLTVMWGVVCWLMFPAPGLFVGMFIGLMLGVNAGMIQGGSAYVTHLILHRLLYRSNYLPRDLVEFLDYASERHLLRKVGGGYIFIHRLLLEHFAKLSPPRL